jgi:hypothetical protein
MEVEPEFLAASWHRHRRTNWSVSKLHAGPDSRDQRSHAIGLSKNRQTILQVVARHEAGSNQAQLGAGEEHDFRTPLAKSYGALGAILEQLEHFLAGQVVRKRAQPNFETRFGGVCPGDLQPVRISSAHTDSVAMQVIVDDLHLPFHDLRVKRFARCRPRADEPGIEIDSPDAHHLYLAKLPVFALFSGKPAATSSNALRTSGTICGAADLAPLAMGAISDVFGDARYGFILATGFAGLLLCGPATQLDF